MPTIETRLATLGIKVPTAAAPIANYLGFVRSGNLFFVSGQLPYVEGRVLHPGIVDATVTSEQAKAAAKQCAINIIAQLKLALDGDLERVERIVKITGFVAATPEFAGHPAIINGASDLFAEVFGDRGKHARAAVGVASLPLGAAVEVEAIVEII